MHKLIRSLKNRKNQFRCIVWLIRYSKPYLPKITLLLLFDIASSMIGVVMAVISKNIIDSAACGDNVNKEVIFYITAILISLFITIATSLISVAVNEKFSFGIRKQLYEKIMKSQWMDIMKYHSGDLVTRLTSDADCIADGVINVIPKIIRLIIEIVVTFFTLFYYQPLLAVFALALTPMVAIICLFLGRKLKSLQLQVQESESNYRSFIQDSLSNLLVVKSFSNEDYMSQKLTTLRNERYNLILKKNRVNIASSSIMSFSFDIGYIAAFAFGALQLSQKAITYGTMSIFLTLVNRIQSPMLSLSIYVPKLIYVLASTERILDIQNTHTEEKIPTSMKASRIGLDIADLSFGYTEGTVFEDAWISIKPGEFVAMIGKSGIGKTTLIRLILSFMNNMQGTIELRNEFGDKVRVTATTRDFIAYVPQGNTLFSGTVRENIRMGKLNATEGDIIEALKMSAAYEFVNDLPEGLDTVIGERGYGLSEGQAQRIAIARALVRKAPFLILDEATSALDEQTELEVLRGLKQLYPRPTCLIITHRPTILTYCDRQIFIKDKKIMKVRHMKRHRKHTISR